MGGRYQTSSFGFILKNANLESEDKQKTLVLTIELAMSADPRQLLDIISKLTPIINYLKLRSQLGRINKDLKEYFGCVVVDLEESDFDISTIHNIIRSAKFAQNQGRLITNIKDNIKIYQELDEQNTLNALKIVLTIKRTLLTLNRLCIGGTSLKSALDVAQGVIDNFNSPYLEKFASEGSPYKPKTIEQIMTLRDKLDAKYPNGIAKVVSTSIDRVSMASDGKHALRYMQELTRHPEIWESEVWSDTKKLRKSMITDFEGRYEFEEDEQFLTMENNLIELLQMEIPMEYSEFFRSELLFQKRHYLNDEIQYLDSFAKLSKLYAMSNSIYLTLQKRKEKLLPNQTRILEDLQAQIDNMIRYLSKNMKKSESAT
jgi:DNA primase large subunit